jgi:hypothetical protein
MQFPMITVTVSLRDKRLLTRMSFPLEATPPTYTPVHLLRHLAQSNLPVKKSLKPNTELI